ncbi:fungal-specific transcription factor domain-containing protein [Plectosphaerella plurivora]|uniref:Fungal-specific transcription factor domain-containing protein n=1 Tax=Plectosphaerella plurivora TaxID=936078 RepID=A0A9P8VE35_9PEZI|nr:fungal-specific transcription factor domain-containing protein [Plectosphaerella plurivora]
MSLLQARIQLLEEILQLHSIDVDASIAILDAQREGVDGDGPLGTLPAYSSSLAFDQMCADLEGALYLDEPIDETEVLGSEARFFGATSGRLELQPLQPAEVGSSSEKEQTEIMGIDDIVSPELCEHLVSLYFEWEQPWFQMVDEMLFRESLHNGGPYSSTFLLLCILAVGSRYSDKVDARTDPDDPRTAGRLFAERAEALMRSDIETPSIPTIQALAIIGTYQMASGPFLGWLHHGMANRLMLDTGLNIHHRAVTGITALPPHEVRLRRQIYWALYCNDKLWANYSGRICTMLDSQATVPLPSPLSEDMPGQNRSHLITLQRAMITHCQILERILTRLYGPKRLVSNMERRGFFDSCILTLKGWHYSLPRELKAKAAEGTTGVSPHALILGMVYHTSVCLLSKPFLPQEYPDKGLLEIDGVPSRASVANLEAAGEICTLAETYREVFGGFRRSPLTATHCTLTAALVIMHLSADAPGALSVMGSSSAVLAHSQ